MDKKEPEYVFLMEEKEATQDEIEQFAADFVALLMKWDNQAKQRKIDS